jgi:hypothetical protein
MAGVAPSLQDTHGGVQQDILGAFSFFLYSFQNFPWWVRTPVSRQSVSGRLKLCVWGRGGEDNSYSELVYLATPATYIFVFMLLLWLTSWNHWEHIANFRSICLIPDLVKRFPWQVSLSLSFSFSAFLTTWKKEQTQWFVCVYHFLHMALWLFK